MRASLLAVTLPIIIAGAIALKGMIWNWKWTASLALYLDKMERVKNTTHETAQVSHGGLRKYNATRMARAFPIWSRSTIPYDWCHDEPGGKKRSGILFVRVQKCASSTGAGIANRMADTLGRRIVSLRNDSTPRTRRCSARYYHGFASDEPQEYMSRDVDRSILWTIIRHPSSRVVSDFFFFHVSRMGVNATERSILHFISKPVHQNYLVNYLRLKKFKTRREEIKHTIHNYDFIAVSERMAESVVVMSMLFKVPLADLIVLSSKVEGYDDGTTSSGCVKLRRSWTTPKIMRYLASDFLQDNHDIVLYQAVNASLDLTIDALGRDKVSAGVVAYHELSAKNKRECEHRAIFPCPLTLPNHTILSRQDCYFQDTGCGHKCTDEVLRAEADDEWTRLQNAL